MSMLWPLALIVCSNVVYQLCTKGAPKGMDPLASLTITYLVGAVFSAVLYFVTNRGGSLLQEYTHINWATVCLGLSIVGLEAGYIYAYKNGWSISTLPIVQSALVSLVLLVVGLLLYHEVITLSKLLGIVICLIGLYFINR